MQTRLLLIATVAMLGAGAAGAQTVQQMRVTDRAGVVKTTEVLKSGKHLETVTCRDFNALDTRFRPQAVTYAANYGPRDRAHPTMTVSGVETLVPVVVQRCTARPGDMLVDSVHGAMAAKHR